MEGDSPRVEEDTSNDVRSVTIHLHHSDTHEVDDEELEENSEDEEETEN
jgi:hypothetical protein